MSVISLSILPASAVYSDNLDNDFKYFIVFTNGDYILSTEPLTTYKGSGYCYFYSSGSYKLYRNDVLFLSGTGNNSNFYNVSSSSEIQSSNYDIYFNDELFFQQPTLLCQLLSLLPGVWEMITADLGTLTVCGVACLALLIGLALLPKVFHKFL